jgi:hypothetical protein
VVDGVYCGAISGVTLEDCGVSSAAASLRRICAVGNATEGRVVGTTYKVQSYPEYLEPF